MKSIFFKIVGGFSLIVASLALVFAIIVGITAVSQFTASADEDLKQPSISFYDIYEKDDKNKTENIDSNTLSQDDDSEADKAFFEKLNPLLESIVGSLNEFAKETEQGSVNSEGFQEYLVDNTKMMGRDDYLILLENLDEASRDLNNKSGDIYKMKPEDENYIHWANDFLPWFIDSYVSEYYKELQRVDDDKLQAKVDNSSSIVTAGVAASAFMVFVFFTLIVLLVQIERNTRVSKDKA